MDVAKLNLLQHTDISEELAGKVALIQDTVEQYLAQGLSFDAIAAKIGISPTTIYNMRRQYPAFRMAVERAMEDGATAILEKVKEVVHDPLLDKMDPARARARMDAARTYLEMRWPEKFGKRLEMTVKTLDLGDALSKARERAGITLESVACVVADSDIQPPDDQITCDNVQLSQEIEDLL